MKDIRTKSENQMSIFSYWHSMMRMKISRALILNPKIIRICNFSKIINLISWKTVWKNSILSLLKNRSHLKHSNASYAKNKMPNILVQNVRSDTAQQRITNRTIYFVLRSFISNKCRVS